MCKLESQKSVDDETTPQSEARRGSHVRPMDAASYRWVIGLLPAPELPEKVAAHLAEILPDLLRSEVDERNDWYVEIVCDPLTGGAGDPAEILDEAEKRKHQHGWDFAISITDLPILRQDHVVVADAVLEKGVGGISVPATGGMLMYRRSERAAVLVLRELVSKEPKHRIDDESRETGQTRLSWMAVSHVDESRASRSATPRRGWKSAVRQPRNLWTAWRGGWVERSPSPNRRRSQIVVPTRKTQKIMRELDPRRAALKEYILSDLSVDERRVLLALLECIRAQLSR